jgi:hypothetical protein
MDEVYLNIVVLHAKNRKSQLCKQLYSTPARHPVPAQAATLLLPPILPAIKLSPLI